MQSHAAFDAKWTGEPNSGCWLWVASVNSWGYGKFGRNRGWVLAHRFSWEMHRGPIPSDMIVCHKCDVPSCVNPDHLFLGTHADNIADRDAKGRQSRGERVHTAKITATQASEIRRDRRPIKEIARSYGVASGTISAIRHGHAWRSAP